MEQGGSSIAAVFCDAFFRVCNYCKNNGKRFVVMAGTFFLFAVYSSFSFPAFITEDAGNDYELKMPRLLTSLWRRRRNRIWRGWNS